MSDLSTIQNELRNARQSDQQNRTAIAGLQATIKMLDDKIAQLNAASKDQAQLAELTEQANTAKAALANARKTQATALQANAALSAKLATLDDPIKQVERLNDNTPFLLMPVRLETRFINANQRGEELWIRVYPDECMADGFRDSFSPTELQQAKDFWAAFWAAGANETQQKTAWNALVAGFGAGRAEWIYKTYKPLNEAAKPVKINPQDMILTIATPVPLSAPAATAAADFWKQVWLADGNTGKVDAALQQMKLALGDAVAEGIFTNYKPFNIGSPPMEPFKRSAVQLSVSFIILPADDTIHLAPASWSQATRVDILPHRFVFVGINQGQTVFEKAGNAIPPSIDISPDPSLDASQQIHSDADGSLQLNESLQWLTDFDKALTIGMAIRISQADLKRGTIHDGFDQLLTIGINMKTDADESALSLQELLQHQLYTKKGLALIPQGTPTNNTENMKSGFARDPDAEESYARVFGTADHYVSAADSWAKKDGQWLAEYLGLDPLFFSGYPGAGGNDQGHARAMNSALWPGTLGYFMDEMMDGVFSDADIVNTRRFFNEYVIGRGAVPAIRLGKQPYGILPATKYSSLAFAEISDNRLVASNNTFTGFLTRLHHLLMKVDVDWTSMSKQVPEVSTGSKDPLQRMLSIVGLQSGSVEFHQRYAESEEHVYNEARANFGQVFAAAIAGIVQQKAKDLLTRYGITNVATVPILSKLFLSRQTLLQGDVVDDTPLDENKIVRNYTADNKNYIQWLAESPLSVILSQDFGGNKAPAALLYLMMRHAKMEQYHRTSVQLYEENNVFANAKLTMREPDLLFISAKETGTSKLKFLYDAVPAITSKPSQTIADYIHEDLRLKVTFPNYYLSELNRALDFLKGVPTAKLERVFTEHLDCCGYRLDAWIQGLTQYRLREQRVRSQNHGIYLGAYGYVENLRPENKQLTAVQLDDELDKIFNNDPTLPALKYDATNAGYIHAPSINQATAAAVLKNAYLTHSGSDQPNTFAINLSSERVRLAQNILDGIRNGQSLSALLGYRFERALHDKHTLGQGEVDVLIYPLRMIFPLVSQQIIQEVPPGPDGVAHSIEQLEARNVLDGLKFINHVTKTGQKVYPFGFPIGTGAGQLPAATALQQSAVNEELKNMQDVNDAVSDMLLSETVYQAVQGNYERSAANSDAASKGGYPPETEIIQTPRSGITCTHRIALHFDAQAAVAAADSPRAIAEPATNAWIKAHLPDFLNLVCRVGYDSPDLLNPVTVTITMGQLKISPVDMLYVFDLDSEQAMNEMDDRIEVLIKSTLARHPAATVTPLYTETVPGKTSFFEVASLLSSMRKVILGSRYANATDLIPSSENESYLPVMDAAELTGRVTNAKDNLKLFLPELQAIIADVASTVDVYAGKIYDVFLQLAAYGLPQTGTGFIADEIRRVYSSVKIKTAALIDRWGKKNTEYGSILAGYAALTTEADRFSLLQKAEREISTIQTTPLPATALTFKNDLENFRITQFEAALAGFRNLLTSPFTSLQNFLDTAEPLASNETGKFDFEFFDTKNSKNDIDAEKAMAVAFRQALTDKCQLIFDDLTSRIKNVEQALLDASTADTNEKTIKSLMAASKLVFGDSFQMLPRFTLAEPLASKAGNSFAGSASLLSWLKTQGNKYPVDDWLYGVGRVREKIFHWENIAMLNDAFGIAPPVLTPLQFPFQTGDSWLAMQFPDTQKPDHEKLLYTAHFSKAFDKTAAQCGLVLDEWVEIIPGTEETTGISFHYDQPNTEPPQAMLLVTPASFKGHWEFQDIVDTITETFALAKKRCVDPALIDSSDYAQLLPATMMGVTLNLITISTSLAINNNHLIPLIKK